MDSDWLSWTDDEWSVYQEHVSIINNWRSSHAYPLNTFQVNLRHTSRRFDSDPLIAQRIKRLSSIGAKLERFPKMKLSQMQDLGGCRSILTNVATVKLVRDFYLFGSGIKHERASMDDYLAQPKSSGYRGVHLVYRYFSDKNKAVYNGLKIELQLRSRYQHAWATAVETVGTFSGEALKSSLGSEEWQRFFVLMASAIALRERSPVVPGTPSAKRELLRELGAYASKLSVERRLKEYGNALNSILNPSGGNKGAILYLLELDPVAGTLNVTTFEASNREMAEAAYALAESRQKQDQSRDAVLVSVESIQALSKAYPNYFADTRLFVELLNQALEGRSRSIVVPARQLELPISK